MPFCGPAFTHSLTGPGPVSDYSGITFHCTGAGTFHYRLRPDGSTVGKAAADTAKRLDLHLGGTQFAVLDFNAPYLGQPFTITHEGVDYEGVFIHGEIDFRPTSTWSR